VIVTLPPCQCLKSLTLDIQIQVYVNGVGVISESSLLNHFILLIHMVFVRFQLSVEKPRSWLGCNDACSFKLRTIGGKMFRSMVVANTTEIAGTMDLAMSISFTIAAGHPGVINSVSIIKGFFGWGTRVSRRRCDGWFRVFLLNKRGWGWCVGSG
jgi:hypothetical protein